VDGDGLLDLFALPPGDVPRILRNTGEGQFEDVTSVTGLDAYAGSSAALWRDVDGDGAPDLYLVGSGRLLRNLGGFSFEDVTDRSGLTGAYPSLSAQWLDIDGDGEHELLLALAEGALLFRNVGVFQFEGSVLDPAAFSALLAHQAGSGAAGTRGADGARGADGQGFGSGESNGPGPGVGGGAGVGGRSGAAAPPPGFEPACSLGVWDQAFAGNCIPASSVPTLGSLYPISNDWYVDPVTGFIGLGTVIPSVRLHVAGSAQVDGSLGISGAGAPLAVTSNALNVNLNADLLDGFEAADFSQLGGTIGTDELEDSAVTGAKIAADAVDGSHVAPSSITGGHIGPGSVIGSNLAAETLTGTQIADGSIKAAELARNSVDGTHVADESLSGADILDGTIGAADLGTDSVDSGAIAAGAVGGSELAAGAVTGAAIAADAVDGSHVADGSLNGGHVANGSLSGVDILDGSISAPDIAANAIGGSHVLDGSLTGDDIANGSITASDLTGVVFDTGDTMTGLLEMDFTATQPYWPHIASDLNDTSSDLFISSARNMTFGIDIYKSGTPKHSAFVWQAHYNGIDYDTVMALDDDGDLTVFGDTRIYGAISAPISDIYINDQLDVSGVIDAQSGIRDSTGTLVLDDTVLVNGSLTVNGGLQGGTVQNNVANTSVSTANLTVSGSASINGSLSDPSGDLFISDNLNISGALYDSGSDLHINDALDVSGLIDAQGGIYDSTGDVVITDRLDVTDLIDAQTGISDSTGNLYLQDYVDLEYDLDVRDQLDAGDGSSVTWQVRATGGNGPTNGYLGVQGVDNYDGNTLVDINGLEIGVLGVSTGSTNTDNAGVYGYSNDIGVQGMGDVAGAQFNSSSNDGGAMLGYGDYGVYSSGITAGLHAADSEPHLDTYGYVGYGSYGGYFSASENGWSVYGRNPETTATSAANGVRGYVASPSAYGVYSSGKFGASGTKAFINPHPTEPTKEVHMVCLEGNESGTYFRGTDWIKDGVAVITVPEVFRLASVEERLTVQVTAVGAPAQLWVESKSLDMIIVRSDVDVEFDYFVNGVRRGYSELTDEDLIVDNVSYWPMEPGKPFATQYPDEYRQILVENGLLNPDFTPNVATMALLEAAVEDYARAKSEHEEMAQERAAMLQEMEARGAGWATVRVDQDPVDSLTGTHPMESQESNR